MLSKKGDIKGIKMIDFGLSKNYSGLQAMQTMSGSVSKSSLLTHTDDFVLHLALLHCARSVFEKLQS
jgi:hypothetical protein